ncbi:hypothetical protein ACROYT_G019609 [Oculina patagonica]
MSRLILVPLLVLSIVAVGQCGTPVACNSGNKNIRYTAFDRTASSNTWEYITSVANNPDEEIRKRDCRDECEGVCVDAREGGPNFDPWPGCKAFSSYVNSGGVFRHSVVQAVAQFSAVFACFIQITTFAATAPKKF